MIKIREDIKKVQILVDEADKHCVHYIERAGPVFIYSYLQDVGEGLVHHIKHDDLYQFFRDLYEAHCSEDIGNANHCYKTDFRLVKEALNVK